MILVIENIFQQGLLEQKETTDNSYFCKQLTKEILFNRRGPELSNNHLKPREV